MLFVEIWWFITWQQAGSVWIFPACKHIQFYHRRGKPRSPCPVNPKPSDTQLASTQTHTGTPHTGLSHLFASLISVSSSIFLSFTLLLWFSIFFVFCFPLSPGRLFPHTAVANSWKIPSIHLGRREQENYHVYTHSQTHTQVQGSHVNLSPQQKAGKRRAKTPECALADTSPHWIIPLQRIVYAAILSEKDHLLRSSWEPIKWDGLLQIFALFTVNETHFRTVIYMDASVTECRMLQGQCTTWPDVLQEPCKSNLMCV